MEQKFTIIALLLTIIMGAGLGTGHVRAEVLQAEFIGNEAFRITDGSHTILTDFPYVSGAYGYMEYEYKVPATDQKVPATDQKVAALITHRHEDHFAPLLFIEQNWSLIAPQQISAMMPRSQVIPWADEITFGAAKIFPKKAQHANVEHYAYLVKWHGKNLFFTGDTEELAVLSDLPELDVLFISPWFYRKALINKTLPTVKKLVIYHHKADDIIPDCTNCVIPQQNDTLIIE